jgi:hypothetical protein
VRGRARPHPSLLLVLVPIVVSGFAFYIANWRWPELATGMAGKTQYWFLRASPVPVLLFGPIAGLLTVWALPLHRRRPIAMASFLCFLLMAGFYGLRYCDTVIAWALVAYRNHLRAPCICPIVMPARAPASGRAPRRSTR